MFYVFMLVIYHFYIEIKVYKDLTLAL